MSDEIWGNSPRFRFILGCFGAENGVFERHEAKKVRYGTSANTNLLVSHQLVIVGIKREIIGPSEAAEAEAAG